MEQLRESGGHGISEEVLSDLLVTRFLPPSSGFFQEFFNGAKLRTRGLEVGLAIQPIQRADVTWLFRTTFSTNRSKITQLDVPTFLTGGFGTSIGAFQIEQGASATQIVGNDTLTAADVAANPGLGAVGDIVVRKIGDANPDFRMSFTNDFTIHRVSLHFLLDWQQGSDILNLTRLLYDFGKVTPDYADPIPGSTQTVGEKRLAGFQKTAKNYLESATFLKLREVTLSFDIPQSTVRSLLGGSRCARLSLSARNLFTATPYTGLDPEVSNSGTSRSPGTSMSPRSHLAGASWVSVDLGAVTMRHLMRSRPMQKIRTLSVLLGILLVANCNTLEVTDLNNPGLGGLQDSPTRSGVTAAATGLLIGTRSGIAAQNGYISLLGIIGRESYNFDPADPRFVTEMLIGPLDGGSPAFRGNLFLSPYANIRNANIVLHATDNSSE